MKRVTSVAVQKGVVSGYVHQKITDTDGVIRNNIGKLAAVVVLKSDADKQLLSDVGKSIAMHIASASPTYLEKDDVPAEVARKEKEVLKNQALEQGQDASKIDRIIEGRFNKYLKESVLYEQSYIMDSKKTIRSFIEEKSLEAGCDITIEKFVCFRLGEQG